MTIIGNLGRDPEMRYTPSGQAVTSFSVASNRKWRDGNGEQQEATSWFNVSCWGAMAESANQYLERGRQVYVEGRMEVRQYEDRNGDIRFSVEVTARELQFLGGGGSQGGERDYDGGNRQQNASNRPSGDRQGQQSQGNRRQQQAPPQEDPGGWDDVDDLPF